MSIGHGDKICCESQFQFTLIISSSSCFQQKCYQVNNLKHWGPWSWPYKWRRFLLRPCVNCVVTAVPAHFHMISRSQSTAHFITNHVRTICQMRIKSVRPHVYTIQYLVQWLHFTSNHTVRAPWGCWGVGLAPCPC